MDAKGTPQWRVRGRIRVLRPAAIALLACISALWACGAADGADESDQGSGSPQGRIAQTAPVRPGIQVLLEDSVHLVRGRSVGLITNHTAVGPDRRSAIDLLHDHPEVELAALFAPEHGIRGALPEGQLLDDAVDERTGLPIHSLYDGTRSPTGEELSGLDVLLFDVQDVGARYYTYVSNMTLAMEAAAEHGVTFVVLDRPNPIGGVQVQGNVLNPAFSSFIGMHPVPMRHGMTMGELAILYRDAFGVGGTALYLRVVPADGWERSMTFEETGLPWIRPSPNMHSVTTALHYPGTCLFEGTNLSVGRGTDRPFEQIGAPWIDAEALALNLNGRPLPDVRFEPVSFTPVEPTDGKHGGVEVHGVRFVATGPDYDPTLAAVHALVATREMAREVSGNPGPDMGVDPWQWRPDHFDLLAGTDRLRLSIEEGWEAEEITAEWEEQLRYFLPVREAALLY